MRSTMYITGKSQRFVLQNKAKKETQVSPNANNSPIGKTMIINLGERTQTGFGNKGDVDMLVGVTDIVTGESHV